MTFTDGFRTLTRQEPLLELLLPVQVPEESLGLALAAREGWAPGPRWAWLDPQGKVRLQGTTLPEPKHLAEQLAIEGWKDETRLLHQPQFSA